MSLCRGSLGTNQRGGIEVKFVQLLSFSIDGPAPSASSSALPLRSSQRRAHVRGAPHFQARASASSATRPKVPEEPSVAALVYSGKWGALWRIAVVALGEQTGKLQTGVRNCKLGSGCKFIRFPGAYCTSVFLESDALSEHSCCA